MKHMKKRRLERARENQLVAGVLAGMAEYFEQDPRLFRLLAIALLLITGIFPGLLLYIVAWIMMPLKELENFDYDVAP
jgi:phage shock protein C